MNAYTLVVCMHSFGAFWLMSWNTDHTSSIACKRIGVRVFDVFVCFVVMIVAGGKLLRVLWRAVVIQCVVLMSSRRLAGMCR